ncbi:hypothetical protein PAPYR_5138 [Paratrimastix pyriformis]|uniref:FCP1 homology domain-containing protein n=1 Tax=Paratrimastix pyriformis TaxID=342808 RepID=A0ABQ8UMZ8_9EUKA|nr:hypothetical protein PAPYR_5138 [Paratrimastix pyriformis]
MPATEAPPAADPILTYVPGADKSFKVCQHPELLTPVNSPCLLLDIDGTCLRMLPGFSAGYDRMIPSLPPLEDLRPLDLAKSNIIISADLLQLKYLGLPVLVCTQNTGPVAIAFAEYLLREGVPVRCLVVWPHSTQKRLVDLPLPPAEDRESIFIVDDMPACWALEDEDPTGLGFYLPAHMLVPTNGLGRCFQQVNAILGRKETPPRCGSSSSLMSISSA